MSEHALTNTAVAAATAFAIAAAAMMTRATRSHSKKKFNKLILHFCVATTYLLTYLLILP
jgi:hypothetical protein